MNLPGKEKGEGDTLIPGGEPGGGNEKEKEEFKKKIVAVPALWMYPIGHALVAVFGIVGLFAASRKRPLLPVIGAATSTIAIIATMVVKFPMETVFDGGDTESELMAAEMMKKLFNPERTGTYTIAVVVTFLVLALVIAHYAIAARQSK